MDGCKKAQKHAIQWSCFVSLAVRGIQADERSSHSARYNLQRSNSIHSPCFRFNWAPTICQVWPGHIKWNEFFFFFNSLHVRRNITDATKEIRKALIISTPHRTAYHIMVSRGDQYGPRNLCSHPSALSPLQLSKLFGPRLPASELQLGE